MLTTGPDGGSGRRVWTAGLDGGSGRRWTRMDWGERQDRCRGGRGGWQRWCRAGAIAPPGIRGVTLTVAELDHVAVLHDVVLAFYTGLARRAGGGDRARRDEVLVRHDLRLDEPALEVGVNHPGRLGRGRTDRDRP